MRPIAAKCWGKVVSREINVLLSKGHNHTPSPILNEIAHISESVRTEALRSTDSPRRIFARSLEGASEPATVLCPRLLFVFEECYCALLL